ncbi:MAG TPA: M56 family metallopeptidase [Puia sp.]|jgi:beta-lactamase regulating signal transducer with metallopeptidase domain|nr:M56 family metallopeptidase [Puia sp.]
MHQLAQSAVLRALGWSLLNSLWQMAFLWLVYVVFTHIFRRASASARHGLAVLLLGSGTVWTILTFFNAFLNADPATSVMSAYRWSLAPFPRTQWVSSFLQTGRELINEGLPYCSTLYLLVLLFLFVRYGRQYFYSRKLIRTGLSRCAPELRVFMEQTARRMGIKKEVKIYLSRLVEGPVTLGSLKPVILVPLATVCNLSTQQVEALVLHELAHIRKHDYLLHLWVAALDAFFFFNPFSRLLIRSIQKEREHRCDDLVLQFRYDPHVYVSALMTLARSIQGNPRLALAATGSHDGLLLQRVKRILRLDTAPEPLKGRPLLFICCTLLIAGMALSRPTLSILRDRIERPARTVAAPSKDIPDLRESTTPTFVTVGVPLRDRLADHPAATRISHKKPVHSHHGDEDNYDDDDLDIARTDASSSDADDDGGLAGYASLVQQRDYSIVAHTTVSPKVDVVPSNPSGEACPLEAPAPYVPNSSFSFQRIQDSTFPGAQYVYMQQMASRQVEQAILKMQKELQYQLKILQQSSSKDIPDLKQKQQIILEQLKLQQQYLEKQQQLQKKLEKIGKKRVIVVI